MVNAPPDREVVVGRRSTPMHVRRAALARVEAGEGVYAVARDVGVGPDRVYEWMKAAGVTPPQTKGVRDKAVSYTHLRAHET